MNAVRRFKNEKSTLLNSDIAHLVSKLGYTDEYTICDAGLPIPQHVVRFDLALTPSSVESGHSVSLIGENPSLTRPLKRGGCIIAWALRERQN
ncbi:hypothetical protein K6Q96_22475 [Grimontia kaedaensis]|uniref:D-ribose pyranase n=1 Tax=Grimontia kaedaensis TaxID=2872157 RepID=A0ABY4WZV3_9GAMM|nr:hypothetical protein K6Q96_22475 [Grimontia kaedaensis]